MKFITRFLFFLTLFTLGRYDYTYAEVNRISMACTIGPAHTAQENNGHLKAVEVADQDDDEPTTFKKKHSGAGGISFTSYFYAQSQAHSSAYLSRNLSDEGCLFFTTSPRYILFGVFRI